MVCCTPQTTFYMPGVYAYDLLKSLAIFHNLCCPSVLAACINFSSALSLLSKSLWKITQRAVLDLGRSASHLLCCWESGLSGGRMTWQKRNHSQQGVKYHPSQQEIRIGNVLAVGTAFQPSGSVLGVVASRRTQLSWRQTFPLLFRHLFFFFFKATLWANRYNGNREAWGLTFNSPGV